MLDLVTQLSKYGIGDVGRALCYEEDSDSLGTDKLYNLFDPGHENLGCIIK